MKNTWEKFYKKRGRYYLSPHPEFNKVISKFQAHKVHNVLDLGCGSGRHTVELARAGFSATGIDFSKEALNLAKKWSEREDLSIKFLLENFHKKLDFKDASYDAVLAIDSVHYDTRDSMLLTLNEIERVLRDKGILFITLPTGIGNPSVTHLIFTKDEILEMIERRFRIIESFLDEEMFLCVFAQKK